MITLTLKAQAGVPANIDNIQKTILGFKPDVVTLVGFESETVQALQCRLGGLMLVQAGK